MDEAKLIEKLKLLEALFVGGATEGEREAAGCARERIIERLREVERSDPPIEYRFSPSSSYSRRLLVSLLRRYGIRPYRYKGQPHTTVMARVPERFVDETLWPQFERYAEMLDAHLSEVTDRVVAQVMQAEVEDAEVVEQPRQLSLEAVAPTPSATAPAPPSPRPRGLGTQCGGQGEMPVPRRRPRSVATLRVPAAAEGSTSDAVAAVGDARASRSRFVRQLEHAALEYGVEVHARIAKRGQRRRHRGQHALSLGQQEDSERPSREHSMRLRSSALRGRRPLLQSRGCAART